MGDIIGGCEFGNKQRGVDQVVSFPNENKGNLDNYLLN